MCFSKGHKFISIERWLDEKRPGLYVGEGNQLLKVAVFSNEEKARIFIETLKEFFGSLLVDDNGEKMDGGET